MDTFIIERDIPGIGRMPPEELRGAAKTSNDALAQLAPRVQWQHSYLTAEKSFCVYLAQDEDAITEHAVLSGFPATRITRVTGLIDPTTAGTA